ncbi:hypothetical protein QDR37_04810 [Amnibacterium sp. CER49]|uniref:hypothetical protein n=1 Tax=Amnibacterium sp. CER49 TaxID=3039161 RepID=UPI00244D0501|nr:hypothetical protein [Amnibacterium sp. CER49]MDH2443262.1 hypothetical protein [Amnibacterium sp. CER49]
MAVSRRPASAAPVYRWAVGVTRAWLGAYARGVPAPQVENRLARLDLELWEHAAAADGGSRGPLLLATEMVARTVLGMRQDLMWRRAVLRGAAVHLLPGPAALLPPRRRARIWLPLRPDHVFDQTNGTIEPDAVQPIPIQYGRPWCGPLGSVFGGRRG